MGGAVTDIFISYARKDRAGIDDKVSLVIDILENYGWNLWFDDAIQITEEWRRKIDQKLSEAKCVIVLWSPNAITSDYVLYEANLAANEKKLVQAIILQCAPPKDFSKNQHADLTAWNGESGHKVWQKVIAIVERLVGRPANPASRPSAELPIPLPQLVKIPAGKFKRGRYWPLPPFLWPKHTVRFARPFSIGKYPVTFDEYDVFCTSTGRAVPTSPLGRERKGLPAVFVTWTDAMAYCRWLSKLTGEQYRLPSEAEWEYTARAGTTTAYPWGDKWDDKMANGNKHDSLLNLPYKHITKVGAYPPNPWKLYDMIGNVQEWCEDAWHDTYWRAPTDGSAWITDGKPDFRIIRGGYCNSHPEELRSSSRFNNAKDHPVVMVGFRVAKTL